MRFVTVCLWRRGIGPGSSSRRGMESSRLATDRDARAARGVDRRHRIGKRLEMRQELVNPPAGEIQQEDLQMKHQVRPTCRAALGFLLAAVVAIATMRPAAQSNPLFSFHSNPWLNLHHFARASARGGPVPTGLSDEESRQWAAGVEFYKPYAARDLLFDDGIGQHQECSSGRGGKASLDGIAVDAEVAWLRARKGRPPVECLLLPLVGNSQDRHASYATRRRPSTRLADDCGSDQLAHSRRALGLHARPRAVPHARRAGGERHHERRRLHGRPGASSYPPAA